MDETIHRAGYDLGTLIRIYTGLPALSIPVAVLWSEFYAIPAFLVTAVLTYAVGYGLEVGFSDPPETELAAGVVTVSVGWFLTGVFSALPLLLVAWTVHLAPAGLSAPSQTATLEVFRRPTNALFEGMSGVTGTGFTMAIDPSELPRTLHWWRSLLQWIGGIGVVVLAAAFASSDESSSFTAIHGNMAPTERIRSTTRGTAAALWWLLAFLTVVSALLLWLAGMGPWGALNHAMTGVTTGGFTVVDGIEAYDSRQIELALLPVMTVGAISFSVLFFLLRGDLERVRGDVQNRWLFGGLVLGASLTTASLAGEMAYPSISESVRYGTFQFVSGLTCTGFQTAGGLGGRWPAAAHLVVIGAMIVGGAAGSTAGGIKLIRVRRSLLESSARGSDIYQSSGVASEVAGEPSIEFDSAAAIAVLWFVLLLVAAFVALLVLPPDAYDTSAVLFEVASAQGNVGLSAGIVDSTAPDELKLALVGSMWIGRLEIVPVVVAAKTLWEVFR